MAEERGFLYNAEQSLGSFMDLFLSNPNRVSPPGVLSGAYAGMDFLVNAATKPMEHLGGVEGGLRLPGADRAIEDFRATQDFTNELLDIENPRTPIEAANRFGSSFAMPLGTLGNAVRAPEGAGMVSRLLSGVARGTIATTVPGSQATSVPGKLLEAGVQVGAPTALFAAMGAGEQADAQPQPDFSDIFGDEPYEIASPPDPTQLADDDDRLELFPSDAEVMQREMEVADQTAADDGLNWWQTGLVAGSLMAGGYLMARRLARQRSNIGQFSQPGATPDLPTTTPDAADAAIFNRGAALQRHLSPEDVARFDIGSNDSAIAQRTLHTMRTGELPTQANRVTSRGTVMNQGEIKFPFTPEAHYGRVAQLTTDQRKTLDDALQAFDEIDSRRASVASKAQHTATDLDTAISPRFNNIGMPGLQRIVSGARGDPAIAKLMDEYHQMTRVMLDYTRSRGLISPSQYKYLIGNRSHYVPQYSFNEQSMWQRSREYLLSFTDRKNLSQAEELLKRSLVPGKGSVTALPPHEAFSRYMNSMLRNVEYNDIRARAIPELEARGIATPVKGPGENVIDFYQNGKRQFYEIEDPHIRQALQFNPHIALPVFNAARRAFQFATTGPANPFFAPTAFTYDAFLLPMAAPKGRAVGLLPAKIAQYVPDITAPIYAIGGIGRGLYGSFTQAAAASLQRSLDSNTMTAQVLGPSATRALQDKMARAHARSTLALFNRYGGGASPFVGAEDFTGGRFVLGEIVPEYSGRPVALQRFYNGYRMLLDSVHNGGRLAFVARNMHDGMSESEVMRLMADTRKLTAGDFARSGSGQGFVGGAVQGAASISPYFNVMLQATHNFVRLTRIAPMRTAAYFGTLGVGIFWAYQRAAEMGPEYMNYVMNEASPEDRTNRIPIVLPGRPPEETYWLPVEPLFTVFTAPLVAAIDGLMGYSTGDYYIDNNTFRDVVNNLFQPDTWEGDLPENMAREAMRGAGRAFAPDPGPVFGSGAALLGYDLRTDYTGAVEAGTPLREIRETELNYRTGDFVTDTIMSQQFQQIVEEFLGASTNLALEGMIAIDDAARQVVTGESSPSTQFRGHFLEDAQEAYQRQAQPIPAMFGNITVDHLTTNNAAARELRAYRDTLRQNNQFFGDILVGQGQLTSQTGQRQLIPGLPPGLGELTDATNRQIVNQMRSFFTGRERAYQNRINATYDLIFSLNHNVEMPHDERVATRNDLIRQLNGIRDQYLWDIKEFEREVSERYGINFDIREFDPTQPVMPGQ